MYTIVLALACGTALNAALNDCLGNLMLELEDPRLHALYDLFTLQLIPQVLHEYLFTMALSIDVEVESGLHHVLVNDPDRRCQKLILSEKGFVLNNLTSIQVRLQR